MNIEKDRVVSIDYQLKNAQGDVIDASEPGEPLVYLHGNQNLIPGLEKRLEGKKADDKLQCVIAPAEGYGERDDELVFAVPRKEFAEPDKVQVGMQFQAQQADGVHIVTVASLTDEEVTVDANHPLAGQSLHFDVTVREVREASAEELSHGHVHGDHECGCGGSCDEECGEECGDDCGCASGCGCGGD
ncbi:MAG TPA: peptidylprolyl isomerase [Spirochaetaceae bacterium]|nr:peptidylprolyl isomerase [Spirochaetaceae bacterium]